MKNVLRLSGFCNYNSAWNLVIPNIPFKISWSQRYSLSCILWDKLCYTWARSLFCWGDPSWDSIGWHTIWLTTIWESVHIYLERNFLYVEELKNRVSQKINYPWNDIGSVRTSFLNIFKPVSTLMLTGSSKWVNRFFMGFYNLVSNWCCHWCCHTHSVWTVLLIRTVRIVWCSYNSNSFPCSLFVILEKIIVRSSEQRTRLSAVRWSLGCISISTADNYQTC